LLVTLSIIHRFNFFTHRLSNKPFLSWLLTTPPHLKYVAILLCNLSLMACFADINVSQGSVATYARCGGIVSIHLNTNLLRNLPVKFFKRLRFDRIMVMSLWPHFFSPPCTWRLQSNRLSVTHLDENLPDEFTTYTQTKF